MTFKFQWLCELFDELDVSQFKRALTVSRAYNYEHHILRAWYARFNTKIERNGPSAVAFLSCLLPERRPDRTYDLREKRLSQIFGRALRLGCSRAAELSQWQSGGSDFATCVERVMKQCENEVPPSGKEVTLEEINEILDLIAARSPSSSPAIRAITSPADVNCLLADILRRLRSHQAKWLVRMFFKRYTPVQVPEYEALHSFHFMLPNLLMLQNSIQAAVAVLSHPSILGLPAQPEKSYEEALGPIVAKSVEPCIGVMVKRQPYYKARSIKHCCKLTNAKQMSVERKYDGEYCQIHIDLSKGDQCLQIFSKSGRDSTDDRIKVHNAVKDALRIGRNGCQIASKCIIEGELLVWCSAKKRILPFHKIKKYVRHGGRNIGTSVGSPTRPSEQLMIAFYDILLLDNQSLLDKPHKIRRQYLKSVLQTTEGRAILGKRIVIDFASKDASSRLRQAFAAAIRQRWEGFVLKDSNGPYFLWSHQQYGIKLKKDYLAGLGDTADLCIVGGRRDTRDELEIGQGNLKWTLFYLGALCNKSAVRRFDAKPSFKIVDTLTHHSMPICELQDLNALGQFVQVPYTSEIAEFSTDIVCIDIKEPTELFRKPFVVEIMGAGFVKRANSTAYTLRFPRKTGGKIKIQVERALTDTTSFRELQEMAEQSLGTPSDTNSQEDAKWVRRLLKIDGDRQSEDSTQRTHSTQDVVSPATTKASPFRSKNIVKPVFVRPDTEEPETQQIEGSTAEAANRSRASICLPRRTWTQSPKSPKSYAFRAPKRALDYCTDASTTSTQCKKPRPEAQVLKQADHPSCVKLGHLDQSIADDAEECTDLRLDNQRTTFNLLPVAHTPTKTSSDSMHDSHLTPDSTKLMREILFATRANELGFDGRKSSILGTIMLTRKEPDLVTPRSPEPTNLLEQAEKEVTAGNREASKAGNQAAHEVVCVRSKSDTNASSRNANITGPTASNVRIAQQSSVALGERRPPRNQSLSCILLSTNCYSPQLFMQLKSIEASFTYSVKVFLDQVEISRPLGEPYHVMMTNLNNIRSTVDCFATFAQEIQSRQSFGSSDEVAHAAAVDQQAVYADELVLSNAWDLNRYNNKILVFGHEILSRYPSANLTLEFLQNLDYSNGAGADADLFCGILHAYWSEKTKVVGIKLDYHYGWTR